MSLLNQKTIAKKIKFNGIGIHSGKTTNLSILPGTPNSGILFKRIDVKRNNLVYPNYQNVTDTTLCTTISNNVGIKVSTIEHLMGAFYAVGIDNAIVEVDAQEVPILDGSAKVFVNFIKDAGLKISNQPIKLIKINKLIEFSSGNKFISINPSNVSGDIEFEIKYKNKLIGNQKIK